MDRRSFLAGGLAGGLAACDGEGELVSSKLGPLVLEVAWGDKKLHVKTAVGPVLDVVPAPGVPPFQLVQLSEEPARTWGITLALETQSILAAGNVCNADFTVTTGVGRATATQQHRLTLTGDGVSPKFATLTLIQPLRSLLVGVRFEMPGPYGTVPITFTAAAFAAPQFPILRELEEG